MNILNAIVNAQGGAAAQQLASQFGLSQDQAHAALAALVPSLAAGMQKHVQGDGGLGGLVSTLSSGNPGRYLDNPRSLGDPSAVTDGNGFLGHLLGSKDASRAVATNAAAQTGLSADILKRMLPFAASLMMGALATKSANLSSGDAALARPGGSGGGIDGLLGPLLDSNRDGSAADDLSSLIGRIMKRL